MKSFFVPQIIPGAFHAVRADYKVAGVFVQETALGSCKQRRETPNKAALYQNEP